MTGEERENALHCLKVMIDEEVCEECKLYGTTGTDHCEADCVRVAIKALEQEPRWIPVSERLPKEQGLYLVTIKSCDKYYIDTDLYNTLYKKGFRTPNVIAWMPLPEPYKHISGEEQTK